MLASWDAPESKGLMISVLRLSFAAFRLSLLAFVSQIPIYPKTAVKENENSADTLKHAEF